MKVSEIIANVEHLREKNADTSKVLSVGEGANIMEAIKGYRTHLEKKWSEAGTKLPEAKSETATLLAKLQDHGLSQKVSDPVEATIVGQETK